MSGRPVILIVDDRPENLLALEAVLEPLEAEVVRAGSGEGALRRLLSDEGQEVTVIILDVQMPGMDGFETAERIKAREKTRHIPIVFLTAISTEQRHALRGYDTGAVDYVSKPFDPDLLRAKVSVLVELQQHARTIEEQRVLLAQRLEERDRAQAALARQTLELERSNLELERFATALSTELRDPLHLVAGFLDLLGDRHGGALGDDGNALLGHATDATNRLLGGLDRLLGYATVSTEAFATEAVDLGDVVAEVQRAMRGRLDTRQATFSADPLPEVQGDRWQLGRLLTHLVDNALLGAEPGVEIHVGVSRRDGDWVISVRDDGEGLSEPELAGLFTLLAPRLAIGDDGTARLVTEETGGVGLAVARRIVERHGGTIWADAVPGQGTTISFSLPSTRTVGAGAGGL